MTIRLWCTQWYTCMQNMLKQCIIIIMKINTKSQILYINPVICILLSYHLYHVNTSHQCLLQNNFIIPVLVEFLWQKSEYYKSLQSAVILAKCMKAKLWENSKHVAKQLPGIGKLFWNNWNQTKYLFRKFCEVKF